jgi:predicted O-methyltransferase YrrM
MKTFQINDAIYDYVVGHCQLVHPILPKLAAETLKVPMSQMQIAPDQGALMHVVTKLIGARKALEVGCFTGYSAICIASALPEGGKLITMDVNPETAKVATRYFQESGLGAKIDLRLGPALETLAAVEKESGSGSFDLMFIDADKANIPNYYEWGLKLLRTGGLIIVDNVLWSGKVVGDKSPDGDTQAIKRFNDQIAKDERVDRVMLHISDGLYLLRKR